MAPPSMLAIERSGRATSHPRTSLSWGLAGWPMALMRRVTVSLNITERSKISWSKWNFFDFDEIFGVKVPCGPFHKRYPIQLTSRIPGFSPGFSMYGAKFYLQNWGSFHSSINAALSSSPWCAHWRFPDAMNNWVVGTMASWTKPCR